MVIAGDGREGTRLNVARGQTLTLTLDPRLDRAAARSAPEWEDAARMAGVDRASAWLVRRLDDPDAAEAVGEAIERLLAASDEHDRAEARAELAELIEGGDDLLAETLLEAARMFALEIEDGEMLASVTQQLAASAERQDDLLTAAEHHVDFLNWRRQAGHASDPDDVETSFDEVIRYAGAEGETAAAALYSYRQAAFNRLVEADEDRAVEGDWERNDAPYQAWG